MDRHKFDSAEIVIPCASLDSTLDFFTNELGFLTESIFPADAPRVAVISGYGVRLRLDEDAQGDPGTLRLLVQSPRDALQTLTAPNGTNIVFERVDEAVILPPLAASLVVIKRAENDGFGVGRAGMQYRDLIPDRYGGRFIASHIRIPDGGPVPDEVHHHHVQFQLIFCVNGWVKVVYEDQGEPLLMKPGDCFLQPPHIRHRVLESSDQLEVVEISCPAEHETRIDHAMQLPTEKTQPKRKFGGQRFVFHRAAEEAWTVSKHAGLEQQATAIVAATNGIVDVRAWRASGAAGAAQWAHDGDLRFLFVLHGEARFDAAGTGPWRLQRNDSCAIPRDLACELSAWSDDFSFLEVYVPA